MRGTSTKILLIATKHSKSPRVFYFFGFHHASVCDKDFENLISK